MKRRRVKITGIGPVTPAGIGREEYWRQIVESVSRIRAFNDLGEEFGPFVAGYIDDFLVRKYIHNSFLPKGAARHTQFAVAAARLAVADAGIKYSELCGTSVAVVAGSSLMDFEGIGRTIEGVLVKGIKGASARTVFTTNGAVIPSAIVENLEINARSLAIQTSCCAGIDAIGHAMRMVSSGEVEIAICGGTEAPLFKCPLVELRATGLTPATVDAPHRLNRPFDLWRSTGVVSEGACMLILEPETSPRPGYAFVSGYAFASDQKDKLCSGLTFAIGQSLADASIRPNKVDVINAWGPGHCRIDSAEASALDDIFGEDLRQIPAFSIKGAIGNPLGAAAAIQVATSALSFRHEILPPTVNWQFPDPACPLNLSNEPRHIKCDAGIVNAHGLSGVNSSIVMTRC